jgi:hypothetical protein
MRNFWLLVIFLFQFGLWAKGQVTFQKCYASQSILYNVQQTIDSGFIATGINEQGPGSVLLIKTNEFGDTLWSKNFHSSVTDMGAYVNQTKDGGYLITALEGTSTSDLIRTNAYGDTLWTKKYNVTGDLYIYQSKEIGDGGLILVGSVNNAGTGNIIVIKCDSSGNVSWVKNIASNCTGQAYSILETVNNCFVFAGRFDSSTCLISIDSTGDTLWTKCYDKLGGWEIRAVDSGYSLFGYPYTGTDLSLAKTDLNGNLLWLKTYEGFGAVRGGMDITENGGYIMNGLKLDSAFNQYAFMIKTDSVGDTIWCRNYSSSVSRFSNVCKSNNDGFICSGASTGVWYGELFRSDLSGHTDCGETVDHFNVVSHPIQMMNPALTLSAGNVVVGNPVFTISSGVSATTLCSTVFISDSIKSYMNFALSPNPATSECVIQVATQSVLRIINMLGECVYTKILLAGKHSVNCESFTPGIYFVKVETENGTSVQKLVKQ